MQFLRKTICAKMALQENRAHSQSQQSLKATPVALGSSQSFSLVLLTQCICLLQKIRYKNSFLIFGS